MLKAEFFHLINKVLEISYSTKPQKPMKPSNKPNQKTYRKGSSLYFSAGLVFSMVLIVSAFEWKTPYDILNDPIPFVESSEVDKPIVVAVQVPAPPKPKIQTPEIIISPEPDPEEPIDKEPPVKVDDPVDIDDFVVDIPGLGAPVDHKPEEAIMVTSAAVPAIGYDAFYKYIFDGLHVPKHLIRRNKDGQVRVSFVIDTDGSLTDIQIINSFDEQLDKQIIKLLKEAPAWKPAIKEGLKVKTRMELPITIKINH